uniref:DUF1308 domain-containing protein n=1 Tax=Mycena chlorophos TaxID=658473 RepID=A0ABQ0L8N6_MYCCL|nr:predicted protein [Mycena chlorophos]
MASGSAGLRALCASLQSVNSSLSDFKPAPPFSPILDSSTDVVLNNSDSDETVETLPGLKQLKELVKIDLDLLERFLEQPDCDALPPLSTNALYLIAVWNEVKCAPLPLLGLLRSFPGPIEATPGSKKKKAIRNLVKVDVVAEGGGRWIRVNTIRNSRILAEFREIDSYLTDSDSEGGANPSLAQTELDNSVTRMARTLLKTAEQNPVDTPEGLKPPSVTLRLTRLEPGENDPRIAETVSVVRNMGVDVQLGERTEGELSTIPPSPPSAIELVPSSNINLDLSVLIAFVSDLTHAALPASLEDARTRFLDPTIENETGRALTTQIMQEMLQEMGKGGMFKELHDRLTGPVTLWTTSEARQRFLRIVSKIGGPSEKRRAAVLFDVDGDGDAEAQFWEGSRFPRGYIPCLPIHVYPEDTEAPAPDRAPFLLSIEKTCIGILAQESAGPPSNSKKKKKPPAEYSNNGFPRNPDSERATPTRANAKLTAHTVESMLHGARRGWTTLTANRSSVRALVRELRSGFGIAVADEQRQEGQVAAIWVVDPRSLAESTRERVAVQREKLMSS